MICPSCSYDNITGVDVCEECGVPLVDMDPENSELEESIARHEVAVLCPKSPITVKKDATAREAVALMVAKKIGCVLVEEDGRLIGVFTERDVLNKVAPDLSQLDTIVGELMTPTPTTIANEDSIAYALSQMDLGAHRHMPIVDENDKPTGVISMRDILRFLCVRFAELRPKLG